MFKPRLPQSKHLHWLIWAYDKKSFDASGDQYFGTAQLDVLASSYDEAMARARMLKPVQADGAGYELRSVVEHLPGACAKS